MKGSQPPWTLAALLDGFVAGPLPAGAAQSVVTGVHDDSRQVRPGGVFFALRGAAQDGRRFVADAAARGAIAIVGSGLDQGGGPLAIDVPEPRSLLARAAFRWHGVNTNGAGALRLVGVTGTNGKSTTAFMAAAILRAAGLRCGMLGTVQYDLCGRAVTAGMTTPGPIELAAHLRTCQDNGAQAVVMEVSSHALDQRRCDGLRFAAAAFTNLTQDHLDYHGTLEAYRDAKKHLFDGLDQDATAVVNRDDPQHEHMLRDCPARRLTFALDRPADLTARITRDSIRGTLYRMRLGERDAVLENALVGRHNVYNALTAAGLALALGVESRAIEAGLASVRNIPGRLQRVLCLPEVEVFVDYAHTDDALRNVLSVLRPLAPKRVIVVFGCGGDRDRTKRPRMARAVAEFADAIYVTSDNPRTEQPRAIIDEIMSGFSAEDRERVQVEPDRRAAIRAALAGAAPGDVVLIAGKGHENYQIIGRERAHFDDVEVALQAASELGRPLAGSAAT